MSCCKLLSRGIVHSVKIIVISHLDVQQKIGSIVAMEQTNKIFTVLANRLIHTALLAPPTVTVFAEDVPIHGIAFPGMIEHKRSP